MAPSIDDTDWARVDFLDLISHELRQPLTAALGSVAMMAEPSNLTDGAKEKLLDIALRNLNQLSALIDSLRVFSDADQGLLDVAPTAISVEELFADCVEDFPSRRTHRILVTECPPGLQIKVDKTLFKQVIANLIGNAMKFAPPESTITLAAATSGGDILVTVRDQGPGFSQEDSERIFEKSVRLVPGASGLGLGLYVARAIVRAHHGEIHARSGFGAGAEFRVKIPA